MALKRTATRLVLPGYGGSGPAHWQTRWELDPAFRRVDQDDWDHPRLGGWMDRLEAAVAQPAEPFTLVAHSLACLLVAHWARAAHPGSLARVKAAFLVAPVDPASPAFPREAAGFAPVPWERLPFPSLLVSSSDDPYASPEFAARCASAWGCRHVDLGPKGHINAGSGLGDWEEGHALLDSLEGS